MRHKKKPYEMMLPLAAVLPAVPLIAGVTANDTNGSPPCTYIFTTGCTSINELPDEPEGCDGMFLECASTGAPPAVFPGPGDVHYCCC